MSEKKNNFSLTCNLLSQYIKEKGSFSDSTLGITVSSPHPTKVLHRQPSTMNLLRRLDVSAEKTEAQLTIFYGGKVVVFDNFPAEKVNNLMEIANKSNSKLSPSDLPMPIARRASLHRFFEKRKDRINSKSPYLASESSITRTTTSSN